MYLKDHLEKIQYFYEVARAGTINQASKKLGLTQPSITKSIKILEESVGKALFIRMPRGMKLTEEGEILFDYCHKLFSNLAEIEQQLETPHNPFTGVIRIGTYESIAQYFWPEFLKTFIPKYPDLKIEIHTERSAEIQSMLEGGKLDLALIINPKESSSVEVQNIQTDYFNFYVSSKSNHLIDQKEQLPIIFMNGSLGTNAHDEIETINQIFDRESNYFYKTSSLETVKAMVLNGLGIGLLPKNVVKKDISKKSIKKINLKTIPSKGICPHQIGIAYSKHRTNKLLIQTIIAEIIKKKKNN